jgi:thiamine kinase
MAIEQKLLLRNMSPAVIAASALRVDLDAITAVERIKHGLTNESWLVRTSADAVVVRVSNAAEDALQIDRQSEAAILTVASAAGIGAPVLLCDPANHVLVTRYLGETWTLADASRGDNLVRLAATLRRLHRIEIPAGVRRVELLASVEGYLSTLDQWGVRGALTEQSVRDRAREAARTLDETSVASLCHNDVHYLNIVDSGELRLIDWEYAGAGERCFDLASACVYHGYDKRLRDGFLSAYYARPDDAAVRRLELACGLFEYIRDLWMAVRQSVGDGDSTVKSS